MEDRWWIIETFLKKDKQYTVGKPKSNWREKVYPKPTIWITKDTIKEINKNKNKRKKS
jgi:hypothetical protein